MRSLERAQTRYEVDIANSRGNLTNSRPYEVMLFAHFLSKRWTKNFSKAEQFFLVV